MTALTAINLRQRRDMLWPLGLWSIFGIFGLVTISMMLTTRSISDNLAASIRVLIGLAALLAWVQGHVVAQSLARAAQVLGQRQVPRLLWTDWLRLLSVKTARTWCIVVVACIFVLGIAGTPWRWPTGAALVSVAMALSLARTLSNRGLLPAAVGWCITGGLIVGPVVLSVTTGLAGALDAFSGWPQWLQLLLIAIPPAMAISLQRRWAMVVPRLGRRDSLTSAFVWPWFKRELKRYTSINYFAGVNNREASKNPIILVIPTSIFVSIGPQLHNTIGTWGSTLPLWHPLALAVMIVFCYPHLICKDLHWRMLLAPGGLHRGRLGLYVARSTVEYAFGLGSALLLFAWAFSHLFNGLPTLDVLALIQRYALLPLQLVFAISVATCLRASPRPGWVFVGMIVVLTACAVVYGSYQEALPAPAQWFKAGPGYVTILLGLTLASITLSNRIWTVRKLMAAAVPVQRRTS